ncbi:MAG: DUF4870 domain-containing protein [Myxococcaceae bacterium]|nr:DUF4870 domain-containing protein [Myxococcaceae bacterium]
MFLCLIPLLSVKNSPFVTWHAKQGLVLTVLGMVSCFAVTLPVVGWGVLCLLWPAMFVMAVMGILKAFQGQRWRIPFVADLSEKF